MFTIWGIAGRPNEYVPGSIRSQRHIEKISPAAPVSAIMEHFFDSDTEKTGHHESRKGFSRYAQPDQTADRVPAILAKQIMTAPVVTFAPDAKIQEALELFRLRRFRHVPILNREGAIMGLLSDRDVLHRAVGFDPLFRKDSAHPLSLSVRDVMTKEVLTAHLETEIRSIARVMFTERIGAMPIVDDHGVPAGMITRSDILRTVMQQVPFELWI